MTEMFGEAWSPMSVPDLAPDDDDEGLIAQSLEHPLFGRTNGIEARAGRPVANQPVYGLTDAS